MQRTWQTFSVQKVTSFISGKTLNDLISVLWLPFLDYRSPLLEWSSNPLAFRLVESSLSSAYLPESSSNIVSQPSAKFLMAARIFEFPKFFFLFERIFPPEITPCFMS